MKKQYDEVYCLGVNQNKFSPEIEMYASWDELALFCRTGNIRSGMVPGKDDMPGVTYKGNYNGYRSQSNFTGARSPYVVVDIDFDEKKNNYDKALLKDNPAEFAKVQSDLGVITDTFSDDGYFFLKRSTSRCGLHIVLRIDGLPGDLHEASSIEDMLFQHVQSDIDNYPLHFSYIVDLSMDSVSRVFFLSHDPDLIYDPNHRMTLMKEEWLAPPSRPFSGLRRMPGDEDREIFSDYADRCERNRERLEHTDIFKLSVLYNQLWPEGTFSDYKAFFSKFNKERSKTRRDPGYLERMYEEGKDANLVKLGADGRERACRRVGLSTLYAMSGVEPRSPFADLFEQLGLK